MFWAQVQFLFFPDGHTLKFLEIKCNPTNKKSVALECGMFRSQVVDSSRFQPGTEEGVSGNDPLHCLANGKLALMQVDTRFKILRCANML